MRRAIGVPLLWAIGGMAVLAMAGVSELAISEVIANTVLHETYYVVAHWHFVTWQAVVFGIFAGWYYFFPKVTGYSYSELLGKVHFWLSFIGVSASYVPMVPVLAYMRREIHVPDAFGYANLVSLIGACVAAAGTLVFFVNMTLALMHRRPAP